MTPEAVGRSYSIPQRFIEVSKGPQGRTWPREAIETVAIGAKEPIGAKSAIGAIGSIGPMGSIGARPIFGSPKIGAKRAVGTIAQASPQNVKGPASGSLNCAAILGLGRDADVKKHLIPSDLNP